MPQLQPGMARIRVKDLCLRTFIGINEDEIRNKQDVLINLTILYAAQEACAITTSITRSTTAPSPRR
jgi:D-erythro-7,8-dihydroneopterin triphosphate epimerase